MGCWKDVTWERERFVEKNDYLTGYAEFVSISESEFRYTISRLHREFPQNTTGIGTLKLQ